MSRTFSPDLLVTLPRPGGVQPNPSGNYAVYAESQYNAEENEVNKKQYKALYCPYSSAFLPDPLLDSSKPVLVERGNFDGESIDDTGVG